MGVAFPVVGALTSETLTRFNVRKMVWPLGADKLNLYQFEYFQGFYLYLNFGSILFLTCTYILFLRKDASNTARSGNSEINGYIQGHGRRGQTFVKHQVRYGSSYLRMGVAGKKKDRGIFHVLIKEGLSECRFRHREYDLLGHRVWKVFWDEQFSRMP